MDNEWLQLKGKLIVDAYEDANGNYYLMLDGGTRIEIGYESGVIPPSCLDCGKRFQITRDSPTYLVCDECWKKREDDERERAARKRELAWRDTPTFARIRAEMGET